MCVYYLANSFGVFIAPGLISVCCLPSIDYDYYHDYDYVKMERARERGKTQMTAGTVITE